MVTTVLVFWDIFGRVGREALAKELPRLRERYAPDFIVGNSENLSSGKGTSLKHVEELREMGFDVLTGGNHSFGLKSDVPRVFTEHSMQIRPLNHFESTIAPIPGKWFAVIEKSGKTLAVANLMSDTFLKTDMDHPFHRIDRLFAESAPFREADAILIDFHRETTAELACMAHFLDGRASFVYGTHTHVQTNDAMILDQGTAMQTDIGMTGAYRSSLWHTYESRLPRLLGQIDAPKAENAKGPYAVCAAVVTVQNRKAVRIETIRIREDE